MYDFAQHQEQRFIDQEFYEDEYDEYLLWTSISPQIMIRVNDPFRIPNIPMQNLLQHLSDAGPTPPASPLLVSYTATPNFKFPPDEDSESETEKSPSTPVNNVNLSVAKRTLPTRKRSYSNFF